MFFILSFEIVSETVISEKSGHNVPENDENCHVPEKDEDRHVPENALCCPAPQIGAFGVYNTAGFMIMRAALKHSPLLQGSKSEIGMNKMLNDSCGVPVQ